MGVRAGAREGGRAGRWAHPDELLLVVGAAEQDDRHPKDVVGRDSPRVRRLRLKNNLVAAHLHGSDQDRIQHLIILVRLGGPNVAASHRDGACMRRGKGCATRGWGVCLRELPLDVVRDRGDALKRDLKLCGCNIGPEREPWGFLSRGSWAGRAPGTDSRSGSGCPVPRRL